MAGGRVTLTTTSDGSTSRRRRYAARRAIEQCADRLGAVVWHRLGPRRAAPAFDGDPRPALVTVNFSTTRYLKLMLCTLGEQPERWFLQRIVVVDNGSRDGGVPFLRSLAARVPRVHVVERRHRLTHAAGMRAGVRALDDVEQAQPLDARANVVLFCDPDVVFLDRSTLSTLTATHVAHDAAFVGEARARPPAAHPDVQASFFAVRRDVLARRDVHPIVHDGSPAYALQTSLLRRGLTIADFPSNHGGYVLHRGRTAVEAAARHHVGGHAVVPAGRDVPHYMGVPGGAATWTTTEATWARLLDDDAEPALLDHLADRFADLGAAAAPDR